MECKKNGGECGQGVMKPLNLEEYKRKLDRMYLII
jgi:hypothetical protein